MDTRRLELGAIGQDAPATVVAVPGVALLVGGPDVPGPLAEAISAAADDRSPGRQLARALAAHLTVADDPSPLGAVADVDGGLLVFLHGGVTATVVDEGGETSTLAGTEAATWIDRVLSPRVAAVTLAMDGVPVDPSPTPYELVAGRVPAGWLRVTTPGYEELVPASDGLSDATVPVAEMAAVDESEAEDEAEDEATAGTQTAAGGVTAPSPSASGSGGRGTVIEQLPPSVAEDGTVDGVACASGHLNPPDGEHCLTCGSALPPPPRERVRGPRPPLGVLTFDDGGLFTLEGRYVVGREPEVDPAVAAGRARPILLDDPGRSVSRVHAEIQVIGWDVQLIDRGSTNGTRLRSGPEAAWETVPAGEPRLLLPGVEVAFGERTCRYQPPAPV